MEQRLSLVTLGVGDLARARAFYVDGLGWIPSALGGDEVVFFQLPGMVLALWRRADLAKDAGLAEEAPRPFAGFALAYNARDRAEVDSVLAEAGAAGGRVVKPGVETEWGGYAGYFADPDGHLWEVAWNPGFALDAEGRVTLPR